MTLSARNADLLCKLLGMLGSNHEGERANAARLANKLVRGNNMTWRDVVQQSPRPQWHEPRSDAEAVHVALRYPHILTDWENRFLRDVCGRTYLSARQRAVIGRSKRCAPMFAVPPPKPHTRSITYD
jgi:hypothetical protein